MTVASKPCLLGLFALCRVACRGVTVLSKHSSACQHKQRSGPLAAGSLQTLQPKHALAGSQCCRYLTRPALTQVGEQNAAEPSRAALIPHSPSVPGQERGLSLRALSIARNWPVNSGQWMELVCRSHWPTAARGLCSSIIIPPSPFAVSDPAHPACRMPFLPQAPQIFSAMPQSGRSSLFPGGHRRPVCPRVDNVPCQQSPAASKAQGRKLEARMVILTHACCAQA